HRGELRLVARNRGKGLVAHRRGFARALGLAVLELRACERRIQAFLEPREMLALELRAGLLGSPGTLEETLTARGVAESLGAAVDGSSLTALVGARTCRAAASRHRRIPGVERDAAERQRVGLREATVGGERSEVHVGEADAHDVAGRGADRIDRETGRVTEEVV